MLAGSHFVLSLRTFFGIPFLRVVSHVLQHLARRFLTRLHLAVPWNLS